MGSGEETGLILEMRSELRASMKIAYHHTEKIHNTRAAAVVVPRILKIVSCQSVLDVGCGIGTWLSVFRNDHGIDDVLGIDGNNVDPSKLMIPANCFYEHDLRESFNLARKFDLLLCLEVAEHLPEAVSDSFVDTLCQHSGVVLFSAAIPGQGGQNHINEQWPSYWKAKFARNGYERIDLIRPSIWNDANVDVWYRQNLFVFTDRDDLIKQYVPIPLDAEIHPDLWIARMEDLRTLQAEINDYEKGRAGIARSFRALVNALQNRLRK